MEFNKKNNKMAKYKIKISGLCPGCGEMKAINLGMPNVFMLECRCKRITFSSQIESI